MWGSLALALGIIIGLMTTWVSIQWLWKRVFAEYISDEDVMADRTTCGNCNCTKACRNKDFKLIK